MAIEICDGIYTTEHAIAAGKNGIIFTQRGAVAIDVGIAPEDGQQMIDLIRSQGYEPDRVILTHGHTDHVLGGQAFQDAEVYANRTILDEMGRHLEAYAHNNALSPEIVLASALRPTVMFRDELILNMGNRTLHVFPTPGHSADHTSVYVVEDRVLFAGDAVVTSIVPAVFHSSSALEASLQQIAAMDIEILVAGHGPALHGAVAIQDWLTWLIRYLQRLRLFAQQSLRDNPNADLKSLAQKADFDTFIEGRLPADRFGMIQRHHNTFIKICQEEQSRFLQSGLLP